MKDIYDIENEIEELEKYANIEGSEIGEVCELLISLARYPDYISTNFSECLVNEIISQLKNFKNNFKIVEREVTYTNKYLELVDKRYE